MKPIISLIAILLFSFSWSQEINDNPYWMGEILLNDGTSQSGFIKVPHMEKVMRLKIKDSENSKDVKTIPINDVNALILSSPSGKNYLLERIKVSNSTKLNIALGYSLLLVIT